ncbi:MAG TPA: peptidyl-prolyl cis-trans isomerase [Bryobacteraceae bacterium]|nr:peptidyl-prolyl cis-trans isomerase [Bryobacteraceae bacterium]
MFDLFRSRQKATRYLLGGILMIVAVSMVVTLIPGYGTSSGSTADDNVIATVGSQKITAQEVMREMNQITRGGQLPAGMVATYVPQMVNNMINQYAVDYEFEQLGLKATDDEVIGVLQALYGQFFQNGKLMQDQLASVLAQDGQTLDDAINDARETVMFNKVSNIAYESTVVTPKEIDNELERKYERAKIQYIAFTPAKFRDQVKVTPEQIKAYYDAHKGQYLSPEKRSFQVLVIDQDKVEKSINVTDAQLHAAYSASMDNFRTPERVHVRHIMFKTTDKSDAEKKQILTKAEDVLKQIKAGADFAEMAKKYSDDSANASKGGDLDWVAKGQTVPEFERVAFALKNNEISGIVTTPYSYDIIQVLGHEPARVKPFDEVKASLTDELRKQQLGDRMQQIADQAHAALEKSPGSAASIAQQFGLDVVTVTKAPVGDPIPTLGVSPEIDGALNGMKKNEVSQVLTLPANRLAIAVLQEKFPPAAQDLSEVEGKVRDRLVDDNSLLLSQQKAKEAAEQAKAGEDLDKIAKSMKLSVTVSNAFGHADSLEGLGSASYLDDAFRKPVGTVLGPVNVMNNMVIYKIIDQQKVDVSKLPQEREAIAATIKRTKAQQQFSLFIDSVVSRLAAEGKIKRNDDNLKRLVASLRQ